MLPWMSQSFSAREPCSMPHSPQLQMGTLRQRGRKLFDYVHTNHLRTEHGFLHSPIRCMSPDIAALHQDTLHTFYMEYWRHGPQSWSVEGTSDQWIRVWKLPPGSSSPPLAVTGNHVINHLSSGRFTKHPLCCYTPISLLYPSLMLLAGKAKSLRKVQWPQRGRARDQGHGQCWSSRGQRVGDSLPLSHNEKP